MRPDAFEYVGLLRFKSLVHNRSLNTVPLCLTRLAAASATYFCPGHHAAVLLKPRITVQIQAPGAAIAGDAEVVGVGEEVVEDGGLHREKIAL